MIFDNDFLNQLTALAKENPRLRQNYDLRNSAEDKSQRMLNAIEPGTIMPIHRHRGSSETVVLLRGSMRQNFYDDQGHLTNSWILKLGTDCVGCHIPAGQWHNLECLESGTVLFEAKDGAWEPLQEDDILNIK